MDAIKVNGITYTVKAIDTVDDMAARGLKIAAMFKAEGRTRHIIVQRPKGRRESLIIEWTNPHGGFVYRVVAMP